MTDNMTTRIGKIRKLRALARSLNKHEDGSNRSRSEGRAGRVALAASVSVSAWSG